MGREGREVKSLQRPFTPIVPIENRHELDFTSHRDQRNGRYLFPLLTAIGKMDGEEVG